MDELIHLETWVWLVWFQGLFSVEGHLDGDDDDDDDGDDVSQLPLFHRFNWLSYINCWHCQVMKKYLGRHDSREHDSREGSHGWDGICDRSQVDHMTPSLRGPCMKSMNCSCLSIYLIYIYTVNVFRTGRMSHNFLLNFRLVLLAATMQQALSYLGHSLDDHPCPNS